MEAAGPRAREGRRRLPGMLVVLLVVGSLAVMAGSAGVGAVAVPFGEVLGALKAGAMGRVPEGRAAVVWSLRLPRALAGWMVGATLGLAGAAYQGLFRNPLADPYLMGAAAGAAFGATVAMSAGGVLSPAFANTVLEVAPRYVPAAAFLGALVAVLATVALSRGVGAGRVTDMVLAGVVVGSVLTAGTTYLMLRDADRVRSVFSWTLGNLAFAGWPQVVAAAPYAVVGGMALLAAGRALNALQLGDDVALTLGLPVGGVRLFIIAAASLATGASVSQVGIIGFVGLVVPHMVRRLLGGDYRLLLPASAGTGGMLLVAADLLARTAVRPAELPVGVVTALLGGPFFLYLLRKGVHRAAA